MSLETARIYCTTICLFCVRWMIVPYSGSRSCKSSIVEGTISASQLATHVRHVVERIVVARDRWRKDGGRWLGTMVKCQTAPDEQALQPSTRRSGVPVACSVADRAPALCVV